MAIARAMTKGGKMMPTTTMLPTVALCPNDYNSNKMNEQEFQELITEIRHLGHLPKPVVVRPNEDGYIIVDGEHNWRAAREVGLAEVLCEIIEADDFEAMRQTYKRNQHGTHDPVLLGRMFRRMLEERELSRRALADEISVSEGTIRNALLYADAADLRNGYAFDRLSIRQVRAYLSLPAPIRDTWLDAGADLKALDKALEVTVLVDLVTDQKERLRFAPGRFQEIIDAGLAETIVARDFVRSSHRTFQLWCWRNEFKRYVEGIDPYVQAVARLCLPVDVLDFLPIKVYEGQAIMPVSPDQWATILSSCGERADNTEELIAMIRASIRLALRKAGLPIEDMTDPRTVELMDRLRDAPDFIRDSNLNLGEKWYLLTVTADVPDDILLEIKRETCKLLEHRNGWLAGDARVILGDSADGKSDREKKTLIAEFRERYGDYLQARWGDMTVKSAFMEKLQEKMRDRESAERNALFADPERLKSEVMRQFLEVYIIREKTLIGRPAREVLKERLDKLPWPEFVLLAAYVTGNELVATARWWQAVEALESGT